MVGPVRASVVVPVHNAEATIEEQLSALAGQTAPFTWEAVFVLNRCSDRSHEIVVDWCRRDPRFRMIVADESPGASFARNRGVEASRGEILAFCDADDVVDPEWLEHMVDALTDSDVVGGRLETLDSAAAEVLIAFPLYTQLQTDSLSPLFAGRLRAVVAASMSCSRASFDLVGGFDEEFVHGFDDVAFSFVAQLKGLRLGFSQEAICRYRPRPDIAAAVKQRMSYDRGYATFVRKYAPYQDEGLILDSARLAASALRSALPFPPRLARSRLRFLRIHAARVRSLAVERRRAGMRIGPLTGPPTYVRAIAAIGNRVPPAKRLPLIRSALARRAASWPIVDATLPIGLPLVGGLAVAAPQPVAGLLSRWSDLAQTLSVLELSARNGAVVIDVGAHVGIFTVAAERVSGPDGAVISIEPVGQLREAIHINCRRHGRSLRSAVLPVAVGIEAGNRSFFTYPNGLVGGFSRSVHTREQSTVINVDVTSLDALQLGQFDLMKIDVEGAEIEVLLGGAESLAANPDALVVAELNLESLRSMGRSYGELISLLADRGDLWIVDESGNSPLEGRETPLDQCMDWIETAWRSRTKWYANIVAVPSASRYDQLRSHLKARRQITSEAD